MKDINEILPKLPKNSLGLAMNWVPDEHDINNFIQKSPLPFDSKWHSLQRIPGHNELVVDGKVIRQSDDSVLT